MSVQYKRRISTIESYQDESNKELKDRSGIVLIDDSMSIISNRCNYDWLERTNDYRPLAMIRSRM